VRLLLDGTLQSGQADGLTEEIIDDLSNHETSERFTPREKAALRYADLFKQGEHAIDKDEVYLDLSRHFSDSACCALRQMVSANSSSPLMCSVGRTPAR
jgi:alkylhydroperoxidase family enzyme